MRQSQSIASRIQLFLLTGLLVLGVGCANLAPITEFADISARSAENTGLVTQYVQFPERLKRCRCFWVRFQDPLQGCYRWVAAKEASGTHRRLQLSFPGGCWCPETNRR